MSKHTPGPWFAVGAWVEIQYDEIADICTTNPGDFGQAFLRRDYDESCANARLIAAAPDLLEALEGLIDACGNLRPDLRTVQGMRDMMTNLLEATDAGRSTIAKATGATA